MSVPYTKKYLGRVKGNDGAGILSIEKVGSEGHVDTYKITFTDNREPFFFNVTNGTSGGGGSGGSGLPPVTDADNGRILQVINGQWTIGDILYYDGEAYIEE